MRWSIAASCLDGDLRAMPPQARSGGFEGILLLPVTGGIDLLTLSLTGRREFRHLLTASRQQPAGMRLDVGTPGIGRHPDLDRLLRQLDRWCEFAAGMGGMVLSLDVGPLPEPPIPPAPTPRITPELAGLILLPELPPADPPPAPSPMDESWASAADTAINEIARLAERYSCSIAISSDLSSLSALHRLLRTADCPWLGADIDAVSLTQDRWGASTALNHLGGMLMHLRLKDALLGTDRRVKPTPIGQGQVNWNELLAFVRDGGYRGWMTLDTAELPNRLPSAIAGRQWLKAQLNL